MESNLITKIPNIDMCENILHMITRLSYYLADITYHRLNRTSIDRRKIILKIDAKNERMKDI